MNRSIAANLLLLEQGGRLLAGLDDEIYTRQVAEVFGSSIGAHIRHNLDHFACFLAGLPRGRVDYTRRARDTRLETLRGQALAEFTRLRGVLASLPKGPPALLIRRDSDPEGEFAASSLPRELDFLMSHTIHHYAIVAILCRLQGVATEPGFGVAPSTLRHLAANPTQVPASPCAPPSCAPLPCASLPCAP